MIDDFKNNMICLQILLCRRFRKSGCDKKGNITSYFTKQVF